MFDIFKIVLSKPCHVVFVLRAIGREMKKCSRRISIQKEGQIGERCCVGYIVSDNEVSVDSNTWRKVDNKIIIGLSLAYRRRPSDAYR